ncbi:AAA family ATPase [Patescibacteria group bacterium]
MDPQKDTIKPKYKNITISGKIATGTSTLAKSLKKTLGWKYLNAGDMQRAYDREHGIKENAQGATQRPDDHEREIESYAKKMLTTKSNQIYEGWLSGFVARDLPEVFRVLVICSSEDIRVDRVVNREKVTVDEAIKNIKNREEENISKWKKVYGDYDFWDPKYYNLVIDTYSSGPMETIGKVLDKIG